MIVKKVTYLSDLHSEHNEWTSQLSLWKDELEIFENQLEEVVQKWTGQKVLAESEHFQNIILLQKEGIHALQHNIHKHEQKLAHQAKVNPEEVEEKYFSDHKEMREGFETQQKMFKEMKANFLAFLSKYL